MLLQLQLRLLSRMAVQTALCQHYRRACCFLLLDSSTSSMQNLEHTMEGITPGCRRSCQLCAETACSCITEGMCNVRILLSIFFRVRSSAS